MSGLLHTLFSVFIGTVIPEKDRCKKCEGNKIIQESKDIQVHVDKGMAHGTKVTINGQGDEEVSELLRYFKKYILYARDLLKVYF